MRGDCIRSRQHNSKEAPVNHLFTCCTQTLFVSHVRLQATLGVEDETVNNKKEINHLLLMAKLLASQQDDGMLSYFIGMAIEQNRQTPKKVSNTDQAA